MVRKLALVLFVSVLSLAGAEGAVRVWLRVRGDPFDREAQRRELEAIRDETLGRYSGEVDDPNERGGRKDARSHMIHPYFAFDAPQGALMLERDLAQLARGGTDRYAVMILGGSVAAGFGNLGSDRLKEVLARDPRFASRNIKILNYGVAGFKQPQQLIKLAYLLSVGLEIDAVINLDGFNEVCLSNRNSTQGINPAYPNSREWREIAVDWTRDPDCIRLAAQMDSLKSRIVAAVDKGLASPLYGSVILARLHFARLGRLRREAVECQEAFVTCVQGLAPHANRSVTGPRFKGKGNAAILFAVRVWMESSFSIHNLCSARGIEYLHVLQPTLLDSGSKEPTPKEAADMRFGPLWFEGIEVGYPRLRRAGRELEERGVRFFDASGVFRNVEERIYTDGCHMEKHGNEILAEAIGKTFLSGM